MRRTRLQALLAAIIAVAMAMPSVSFAADAKKKKKKKDDTTTSHTSKAEAVPAPPAAASSKGLEAKLKKDEEEEAPTRLAPAKLETAPGGEISKDAKAEGRRDEEIAEIKKVLPKQKAEATRAQLYFKLAELWWEKSRYVKMKEEMPAFEKASQEWHECMQHGTAKKCGAEPRPNLRKSDLYRQNAVELYHGLIKEYPKYPRIDEVRFYLAYDTSELASGEKDKAKKAKLWKAAIEAYKDLIALHPKSNYVSDSLVELGNYYFDNNDLNRANAAFEEAVKKDNPRTKTYAIYKLAWVRYNQGAYGEQDEPKKGDCGSVCYLKQVVAREEKNANKAKTGLNMKTESLRDLVLSFSKNGERDTAIKYYEAKAGKDGSKDYIVRLAGAFFEAGGAQYDDAIKTYQYLITKNPTYKHAPEWQAKIVLSYDKKFNRQKVREEIQRLVDHYGDKSDWWAVNKDEHDRNSAVELTEEALYNLVTDYHQEAIKTKSVATYKLARDIYKEYIDHFPNTERAYLMRFYYAEILYALEDYQKAFDQYVLVAHDQKQKQLQKTAAKDMLLGAEKLVDIQDGLYEVKINDDSKTIDEKKDKGGIQETHIKASIDKKATEKDLTPLEKQLVAACDDYTKIVPNAEDEARVRLRAAIIYFEKYKYIEAADRFGYIINKWPEDATSRSAAGLILEALEFKQDWERLNKRAREFAANKKLLAGEKKADEFKKKLAIYIEGSQFKLAMKFEGGDSERAATEFANYMKEFPKSKFAPIAGYNAFGDYQKIKQYDIAIEVGEKIFTDFPKADSDDMRRLPGDDAKLRPEILPDLTFGMAKLYELTADFEKAGQYYEKYVSEYPWDKGGSNAKRTPDAQFNAALWYKNLGEDEKAAKSFQKYIDIYKKVAPAQRTELKLVPEAQVQWTLCQFIESHKDWKKFIDKVNEYLRDNPAEPKWQRLNAKYRQFLAFKELKNDKQMVEMAKGIGADYKTLTDEDKKKEQVKLAIAHTQFFLLEPEFESFKKLKFRAPDKNTMAADLKAITGTKKGLEPKYAAIVGYGNGEWAIAALVRIAMLPRIFANDMRNAPMPHGLDADQKEMYKGTLEDKAIEIETPAVDLFQTAMKTAFDKGIYNEWTLAAQSALAEFKPELIGPLHDDLSLSGSTFFFNTPGAMDAAPKPKEPAKPPPAEKPADDAKAANGGEE